MSKLFHEIFWPSLALVSVLSCWSLTKTYRTVPDRDSTYTYAQRAREARYPGVEIAGKQYLLSDNGSFRSYDERGNLVVDEAMSARVDDLAFELAGAVSRGDGKLMRTLMQTTDRGYVDAAMLMLAANKTLDEVPQIVEASERIETAAADDSMSAERFGETVNSTLSRMPEEYRAYVVALDQSLQSNSLDKISAYQRISLEYSKPLPLLAASALARGVDQELKRRDAIERENAEIANRGGNPAHGDTLFRNADGNVISIMRPDQAAPEERPEILGRTRTYDPRSGTTNERIEVSINPRYQPPPVRNPGTDMNNAAAAIDKGARGAAGTIINNIQKIVPPPPPPKKK